MWIAPGFILFCWQLVNPPDEEYKPLWIRIAKLRDGHVWLANFPIFLIAQRSVSYRPGMNFIRFHGRDNRVVIPPPWRAFNREPYVDFPNLLGVQTDHFEHEHVTMTELTFGVVAEL